MSISISINFFFGKSLNIIKTLILNFFHIFQYVIFGFINRFVNFRGEERKDSPLQSCKKVSYSEQADEKNLKSSNQQLEKLQDLIEKEENNQNTKMENQTARNSEFPNNYQEINNNNEKFYEIRFHVFSPREFENNVKNFEIGIISSINHWQPSNINILKIENLPNGLYDCGHLVSGKIKFPSKVRNFEYKYVLRNTDNGECIWEFLGKNNNCVVNRHFECSKNLEGCVVDKFDGLIFPETDDKSNFVNRDILDKYNNDIIKYMINEILENSREFRTIEFANNSLNNILSLEYFSQEDKEKNEIYRILLDILKRKNEKKLNFLFSTVVLSKIIEEYKWTQNKNNLKTMTELEQRKEDLENEYKMILSDSLWMKDN